MTLVLTVILVALIFEYINGFHDTANSIATVVSTKVLTPRQAVVMAACTNLVGALWGTAVAKTISSGLVDAKIVTMSSEIIICALMGAIVWNLITWWYGLPSSSSHALIGGLCGAAVAASGNNWKALIWSQPSTEHWWLGKGLLWKVIVPMITSPIAGFLLGFIVMALLYLLLHNRRPQRVNRFFGVAQIFSAGSMGFMHGTNDAQKTMGIIALALMAATSAGTFNHLPRPLHFLYTPEPGKAVYASMNQLGEMYRDGHGVTASDKDAEKWFRKGADKNDPDALENLAALIRANRTGKPTEKEAAALVKKATELRKGSTPTPLQLKVASLKGAPEDPAAALAWYQQLAEGGNAGAEAFLGVAYLQGRGVVQNEETGIQWLRKAAAHHNAEALFNLGVLHLQGQGVPKDEPKALQWFRAGAEVEGIKVWIKVVCALTMAAGTAAGGWRIIKTLGHKMVKLHPINGFAAEASSATVIGLASTLGIPVSTTHNISAAIMGVGSAKRFNAIKWSVVERIVWAWVLTIPVTGGIAYGMVRLFNALGWKQ
jgi:phosphate/sulfate permease